MHTQLFRLFPALRHPTTRSFALRLAAASLLAMAAANALSIANPWWAAMAVWMLGQPTRGLLLERSLAQLLGTLAGGLAAIFLATVTGGVPALLLPALGVWVALCCGASNLLRHQRSYGAALCGLTTAVIVVLTAGTQIDATAFAIARMLDNAIGIAASLLVVALWNPTSPTAAVVEKARALVREALVHTAATIENRPLPDTQAQARRLVAALAELDATAEDCAAGSLSHRRRLKPMRALLGALLDLIAIAPALRRHAAALPAALREDLQQLEASLYDLADTIEAGRGMPLAIVRTATRQLRGADPLFDTCLDDLEQTLASIAASYRDMAASLPGVAPSSQVNALPARRPDYAGVRLAASRGLSVCFLAAAAWLASGWEPMRYLMLGSCIFITLFASADEPAPLMRRILVGAVAAAAIAFAWRLAIAPLLESAWLSLALTAPLVLAAAAVQADRRTAFVGLAFNMLFAVLAQPVNVASTAPSAMLTIEILLLAGIATSYAVYRWLIPMSTRRRRRHLQRALRAEIAAIAQRADTPQRAARHLARLRFLILGLVARAGGDASTADGALAALALGHALLRMGTLLQQRPDAAETPWIRRALQAMSKPLALPHDAGAALQGYASELRATDAAALPAARWLEEAAACLVAHAAFFSSATSRLEWPRAAPMLSPTGGSAGRHERA